MPTKLIFFSKHGHPSSSQTLSAPSMELTQFKYDVFLSFRGEDTRNNFTSHLHKALCNKHIETFIDYELRRGDEISPSLLKAIEESNISVIVFSKGYASSRWCLEELVKILQCKNTYGQIVVPIFYEVDPSDVRNQTGSFAQAFAEHEERFMESLDKVQTWRNALNKAANLVGLDSGVIKPESVLIENIVQDVLKKLNDMYSNDNNGLIGINSRINEIESLLQAVRSIGLWGVGGVGKTSLAGAVFDKISYQFEASCFVHKVREKSEQNDGLNRLRQELYYAILGDENVNMSISFGGCTFTKKRFGRKKLLVVFDDVTDFRQIEYLVGGFDCLGFGSRIIMTTRNKQVLKNCRVDQMYEVKELPLYDALKLFCRYAFRQNRPILEYENLPHKVVNYLGGIPLALKVLGSSLLDKGKEVWESAIKKLKKILDKDIHEVLKISYDGLNDDQQKIFLDIACFLKGRDIDLVKQFLNACGFFVDVEISGLVDKSLIVISSDNKITMHDLLQAMGREIIRQQSIEDLGQRTRLWHHEDIYHVLTTNTGSKAIEGISFNMSKTKHMDLNPCAFTNMRNMRFLEFYFSGYNDRENKVHIPEGLDFPLNELRYLHWVGCPIKSFQSDFYPRHLVILSMADSNIKQLWNGALQLVNLKEIVLTGSKQLISCPDLSGARNLEKIFLTDCTSLLEIPSSFQYLSKLIELCLHGCKGLKGLPDCFTGLKSLKKLLLGDCTSLKLLPEMPCNVETLNLSGTAIEEVSPAIDNLSKLCDLDLRNCSRLKRFPSSICKLKSLQSLCLGPCLKIDKLLADIGTLQSLSYGSAIREVPSSNVHLSNLGRLSFERCKFQDLNLFMLALSGLCSLTILGLTDCGITVIPDSLGHLSQLRYLYLCRNNFESIPPSIINLFKLECLDISFCQRLRFLPELPSTSICADNCFSLAAVPLLSVPYPPQITHLGFLFRFVNCFNLQNGLNDTVEDVLLKLASVYATAGPGYVVLNKYLRAEASLFFPGSEVPEWFSLRSTGSLITKELPPRWNNNLVGLALCAIVEIQHQQNESLLHLDICCECKLKSKYGQGLTFCTSWGGYHFERFEPYYVESDHLYIGFHHLGYHRDIIDGSCYNTEVTFQFYLESNNHRRIECGKVKSCGVRLLYALDPGNSNGSFNLGEREDESHPNLFPFKKSKFVKCFVLSILQ